MNGDTGGKFVRGFWATSLGTLVSRVLGLVRDVVTASLLGLGQGGVMDALVVALRIPNFSRRVFGEGALAASLLPVFAAEHERAARSAWRVLSSLFLLIALMLVALVLLGEGICFTYWWFAGGQETSSLVGFTAILLPYMVFICLAAQAAAALQGLRQFRWPAAAPLLLNICWLAAAWMIAPRFPGDRTAQAVVIAIAVLVSGVLQLAVLMLGLRRAGFRFEFDWPAARPAVKQIVLSTVPIAFGLAVTQINTLFDSILAVALATEAAGEPIRWLGGLVDYPLRSGAAAAIYYGERFYQLPVGVLGLAIATVLYPTLSRHAAHGNRKQLTGDLTMGLRLVWFTALPAGIGIAVLAEPIVHLLFVRGNFTMADGHRAATMIACYASAAWAYCALPVLARGFYAIGDRVTPVRVGMLTVGLDLMLTLVLIWPFGEKGLAISTALAATMQTIVLTALFARRDNPIEWKHLWPSLVRGAIATSAMCITVIALRRFPPADDGSPLYHTLFLAGTVGCGAGTYLVLAWLMGMQELRMLVGFRPHPMAPKRSGTSRTSATGLATVAKR